MRLGGWDGYLARLVAVAAVVAVIAGVVACGDDSGDVGGSSKDAAAKPLPKDAYDPKTADEEQIVAIYGKFADAMAASNAQSACGTLTGEAKQMIAGRLADCVAGLKATFAATKQSQNKPYIVKLDLNGGKKAQAGVKTKTSKVYPVDFVKQADGSWKISGGSSGASEGSGGANG